MSCYINKVIKYVNQLLANSKMRTATLLLAALFSKSQTLLAHQAPSDTCHVQGICVGNQVHSDFANDYNDCLTICKSHADTCNFFSYAARSNICHQYIDCPTLDQTCQDCYSGRLDCPEYNLFNKLFVVQGKNSFRCGRRS